MTDVSVYSELKYGIGYPAGSSLDEVVDLNYLSFVNGLVDQNLGEFKNTKLISGIDSLRVEEISYQLNIPSNPVADSLRIRIEIEVNSEDVFVFASPLILF